jgi:hypothetical protein
MNTYFNKQQIQQLSSFFSNVAVGWFTAAFIVIVVSKDLTWLILLKFVGNMMGSLYLSLWLLKEENYD